MTTYMATLAWFAEDVGAIEVFCGDGHGGEMG